MKFCLLSSSDYFNRININFREMVTAADFIYFQLKRREELRGLLYRALRYV